MPEAFDDLTNVDCDFYDFRPIDFLGLKMLLGQNFRGDVKGLDYGEMANLIISQPYLGSTAKTDGIDGDPIAFMTLINPQQYDDKVNIDRSHLVPSTSVLSPDRGTSNTNLHIDRAARH